ncbi:MAG: hypothetical protein KKB38_20315 [Gammaproteobacteria bacterium]|nr:hypothetical protein [Gammaproteobacteria bacterium]
MTNMEDLEYVNVVIVLYALDMSGDCIHTVDERRTMEKIGDLKRGYDLGIKTHTWYIFYPCTICGKPRWVQAVGKPLHQRRDRCYSCAGKENAKKWDKYRNDGIIYHPSVNRTWVRLEKDDPYYLMTTNSYVPRARLVLAQHLNRCLTSSEIVHHKNLDTNDDSLENLEVCSIDEHAKHKDHHPHTLEEYPILQKCGKVAWYIKKLCIDCGKERLVTKHSKSLRCSSCATRKRYKDCNGVGYGNWKGGIWRNRKN